MITQFNQVKELKPNLDRFNLNNITNGLIPKLTFRDKKIILCILYTTKYINSITDKEAEELYNGLGFSAIVEAVDHIINNNSDKIIINKIKKVIKDLNTPVNNK